MKDITLSVPDNEYSFFIKVVKSFDFVQVKETAKKKSKKQKFLAEFKEAVEQVKLAREGKIELRNADELINEL